MNQVIKLTAARAALKISSMLACFFQSSSAIRVAVAYH